MEIINQTGNLTKKDLFNARSASLKLSDETAKINVTGCAIAKDADEDGKMRDVGYIFSGTKVYGTVSATAIEGISMLIDMIEDGETDIRVTVLKRSSAAGREFISLTIE